MVFSIQVGRCSVRPRASAAVCSDASSSSSGQCWNTHALPQQIMYVCYAAAALLRSEDSDVASKPRKLGLDVLASRGCSDTPDRMAQNARVSCFGERQTCLDRDARWRGLGKRPRHNDLS